MGAAENIIMHEVMRHFGMRDELRIWRQNVGYATPIGARHPIKYGVAGMADISGIIMGSGRRLEIETKARTKQSPEQVRWQAMIERFGGLYVLSRSVHDVYAALATAGVELDLVRIGAE